MKLELNYPPCKVNKCLKYPMCSQRNVINCTILSSASEKIYTKLKRKEFWDHIHKSFPYLILMLDDNRKLKYSDEKYLYSIHMLKKIEEAKKEKLIIIKKK